MMVEEKILEDISLIIVSREIRGFKKIVENFKCVDGTSLAWSGLWSMEF